MMSLYECQSGVELRIKHTYMSQERAAGSVPLTKQETHENISPFDSIAIFIHFNMT